MPATTSSDHEARISASARVSRRLLAAVVVRVRVVMGHGPRDGGTRAGRLRAGASRGSDRPHARGGDRSQRERGHERAPRAGGRARRGSVLGVARRMPGMRFPKVEWTVGGRGPRAAARRCSQGADAVVHLAWLIQPGRDRQATLAR